MQDFRVGHVHFMLFMSIWAPNANSFFSGIWALGTKGRRQHSLAAALISSSQLQPTYMGKLYVAATCCIILAAASSYEF